jgi:hypothetical protein
MSTTASQALDRPPGVRAGWAVDLAVAEWAVRRGRTP